MKIIQKPRGTQDIYGDLMQYWHYIEENIREITAIYQYQEMRTPMFENIELFARGVGETSDIVSKEMYEFYDKKNRRLALKPESTATIVRSYIENKLYVEGEYHKYYYISPHFRYERAQAGRYRQHHQFGVETFGDKNPFIDAEVILLAVNFLMKIGIKGFTVKINSLGDTASRLAYREALQNHFKPVLSELCEDCQIRYEKNPLRILDCKKDAKHPFMETAPKMADYLSPEAKAYMDQVLALLDEFEVHYEYDNKLVRGLDYYTHTVFEIVMDHPNSAKAGSLCGGGRYDGLIAQNGGPEKSGIGYGMGIERLIIALKEQEVIIDTKKEQRIFIANIDGVETQSYAMKIAQKLRDAGVNVDLAYSKKNMKAIFKLTDRFNATDLIVLGETERENQTIEIKDLENRTQQMVAESDLLSIIK